MSIQRKVSFDVSVEMERQTPRPNLDRSKSDIELDEKMEQRAKDIEKLILLGQATLEEERCDIKSMEDDTSLSPAKRRRMASESWQLLFDYAEEVSTKMQVIDRDYWRKPVEDAKDAAPLRYDLPGELLFVADTATPASEKLSFARTKHKLSKVVKSKKAESEGRLSDMQSYKEVQNAYTEVQNAYTDLQNAYTEVQSTSRQFWPEVTQLKKDMNALRDKLREAKRERSVTNRKIQDLQDDLVKLEEVSR